jgi:hypothetical protein
MAAMTESNKNVALLMPVLVTKALYDFDIIDGVKEFIYTIDTFLQMT